MRRKLMWVVVVGAVSVAAATYVRNVLATPSSGFTATTIATGRFGEIDVANHVFVEGLAGSHPAEKLWRSVQHTKGVSDLFVQSNVWVPGGSTGWHSHPGHSLIIVTAGTVTAYEADDPSCTPQHYTVGMGFVDRGGDHAHLVRNEGTVEARTIAVQLIPAGATRRIDAQAPATCPF